MDKSKLLERAIFIAVNAHIGQTDKAGKPYIFHPLRVMQACPSIDEKIVAVLHDTIEDTTVTTEILAKEKFPQYIIDAVLVLTKDKKESYADFIRRVSWNPLAAAVKIEDIKDNMDTSRLTEVTEEDRERLNKYASALRVLKASNA